LWLLQRLDAVRRAQLNAAHTSRSVLGRVHAQRIAADTIHRDSLPGIPLDTDRIATAHMIATQGLSDGDPLVQRCAAEAVGKLNVVTGNNVRALLDLLARVPREDTHLLYTVRKALRDQLIGNGIFDRVTKATLSEQDERAIADVAVAVPSAEAGEFLLRHVQKYSENKETLANYLRHSARYAPE